MTIAVLASDAQWEELIGGVKNADVKRISVTELVDDAADAFVLFDEISNEQLAQLTKPVLLNSVIETLAQKNAGVNVIRFNGWNGFAKRKTWDIAGLLTEEARLVFDALDKQMIQVADEPGLVAARPVAMIINEAYFALEEAVSTRADIDVAMKLGTNYPLGPFEWADQIGLKNIYALLLELSKTDKRYTPANLLKQEATA